MKNKKSPCFQEEEIKKVILPNGISLSMVNGKLKRQYRFQLFGNPDQVEFCFFKRAHLEFSFFDDGPGLSATPMQTHLVISKKREGEVAYFADSPCVWLTIRFSMKGLERMFSCFQQTGTSGRLLQFLKSEKFFCHSTTMTSQMNRAFDELFFCPFNRDEHMLYAQAKCMELIALKLMQIETPSPSLHQKSNANREELIAGKAATILLANLVQPPCLQELASQVGVSSSRLKQVFPRVYGISPFGFLRRHRLEHAKNLILHSGFSASDAAFEVGYSELSPFHRAFVKEFGISPGQCRSRALY